MQKGRIIMDQKQKLLIVDDNAELRNELAKALATMEDITLVGTASNGMMALDLIVKHKPDIILLDIIMPQLDGFGVIEYIREQEQAIDVIVLSALAQESFVLRALELGIKYYMAKPFQMDSLKSRINDLVMQRRGTFPIVRPTRSFSNNPLLLSSQIPRSADEKISTVFITIGIPAHIKGYHFLREAIKMMIDNPDVINRITKELYPGIGKKFNTSSSKVERAIRHAIEVAWTRGKIENINQIFGYNVYSRNDKPTNGEFIALIADKLILERSA